MFLCISGFVNQAAASYISNFFVNRNQLGVCFLNKNRLHLFYQGRKGRRTLSDAAAETQVNQKDVRVGGEVSYMFPDAWHHGIYTCKT